MISYKKLASTNYNLFLAVCILLYHTIKDVESLKEKYKKAGNISEFNRWYNDLDLKRYKRSFNTAKNYLKGNDFYNLAYMNSNCNDIETNQKVYNFICDKFGY